MFVDVLQISMNVKIRVSMIVRICASIVMGDTFVLARRDTMVMVRGMDKVAFGINVDHPCQLF